MQSERPSTMTKFSAVLVNLVFAASLSTSLSALALTPSRSPEQLAQDKILFARASLNIQAVAIKCDAARRLPGDQEMRALCSSRRIAKLGWVLDYGHIQIAGWITGGPSGLGCFDGIMRLDISPVQCAARALRRGLYS
jgi:hypothetical protein